MDSSVPHSARIYNCLLGGTHNFPVDREAAESAAAILGGWENARSNVRAQREFLARAVCYLAGEAGIRQFLDIGCGIPAEDHTHEVAQRVAPDARIVYVDNDPIVATHAQALLESTPQGATAYVEADLRDPEGVLEQASALLDLTKPVAILLLGVLHHIEDEEDPQGIVARLVNGAPSGSYVAVAHLASDIRPDDVARLAEHYGGAMVEPMIPRGRDEISRLLPGLEIVAPGIVPMQHWRPDEPEASSGQIRLSPAYGGVARKP